MKYIACSVLISTLLALFCVGCVAPGQKSKAVGDKMKARLGACTGRLTKTGLIKGVGMPSAKHPREDGGELWLYRYDKTKRRVTREKSYELNGKRHIVDPGGKVIVSEYQLEVTVGFNKSGIMDDWSYNGNTAAFPENRFTRLYPSAARSAPPAPAPAPAPAPVPAKPVRVIKPKPSVAEVKPPVPRGVWVSSADAPAVKVFFDSFPKSACRFCWKGETVDGCAHGQGIVMVRDNQGAGLGAYVGTFNKGNAGADLECIINEENRTALPEMSLGGVPWK